MADEAGTQVDDLEFLRRHFARIRAAAQQVADGYNLLYGTDHKWREWGANSQEDFWSIAQDNLGIPRELHIPIPDPELDRSDE